MLDPIIDILTGLIRADHKADIEPLNFIRAILEALVDADKEIMNRILSATQK
jgi:flagellin-specific chaperone FliS